MFVKENPDTKEKKTKEKKNPRMNVFKLLLKDIYNYNSFEHDFLSGNFSKMFGTAILHNSSKALLLTWE